MSVFFCSVYCAHIGIRKRRPRVVKCNDKQTNKPFSLIALAVYVCVRLRVVGCDFLFLHFHGAGVAVVVLVFRHRLFPFSIFHRSVVVWRDVIFLVCSFLCSIICHCCCYLSWLSPPPLPPPTPPPLPIFGLPLAKRFEWNAVSENNSMYLSKLCI